MPIVTRTLDYVKLQADGKVRVQERLVDHLGRVWNHTYKALSEDAATTAMNARDMTAQLKRVERKDVVDFVRNGDGTPDDFSHIDLTVPGKRRAAIRWFSIHRYDEDPIFFDNVATWIAGLTPATIESVLGVDNTRAVAIKGRANTMDNADGITNVYSTDSALLDEDIEVE